jgi:hypothetical protein
MTKPPDNFNDPVDEEMIRKLASWFDSKGLNAGDGAKLCFDFLFMMLCAVSKSRDQLDQNVGWLKQSIDERSAQMHRRQ